MRASIPALPNCTLDRPTREEALSAIQQTLADRLTTLEIISVDLTPTAPELPWMKFAGVFKNDPDFAAIVHTLRTEREIDVDSPAYSLSDIP